MKKTLLLLQFVPLTAFVAIARRNGFSQDGWSMAFQIGGALAVAESVVLCLKRTPLNRFILAVNLFLCVGGAAFALRVGPILSFYHQMMEASLFLSVLVIGIATTLWSDGGFIGATGITSRRQVKRYSVYLLIVTAFCLVCSLAFRSNIWLAGMVPFVILILARATLLRRLAKTTQAFRKNL